MALHAFQEVDAFLDPAPGQQHMGQGVLGPGLVGLQGKGLAGGGFGVFQQVALLIGEGQQAVAVGDIRRRIAGLEGDAQQRRPVAAIELHVLGEFGGEQVPGETFQQLLAEAQHLSQVVGDPGAQQRQVQVGPGMSGGGGACPLPVALGQARAFGGLAEHQQDAGESIGQARLRIGIGGGEDRLGAGVIAEKTADERVDAFAGRGVLGVDGVAQVIQ